MRIYPGDNDLKVKNYLLAEVYHLAKLEEPTMNYEESI